MQGKDHTTIIAPQPFSHSSHSISSSSRSSVPFPFAQPSTPHESSFPASQRPPPSSSLSHLPQRSPDPHPCSSPCTPSAAPTRQRLHRRPTSCGAPYPPAQHQAWCCTCRYPSCAQTAPTWWVAWELEGVCGGGGLLRGQGE